MSERKMAFEKGARVRLLAYTPLPGSDMYNPGPVETPTFGTVSSFKQGRYRVSLDAPIPDHPNHIFWWPCLPRDMERLI